MYKLGVELAGMGRQMWPPRAADFKRKQIGRQNELFNEKLDILS